MEVAVFLVGCVVAVLAGWTVGQTLTEWRVRRREATSLPTVKPRRVGSRRSSTDCWPAPPRSEPLSLADHLTLCENGINLPDDTKPPGYYGPGDYGPDSWGGSDYAP